MDEQPKLSPLDRAVEFLGRAMNAVGLNGTRLQWKWNQRRRSLGEAGMKTEVMWRSTKGRHKMCPSCRTLVARSATRCPECDASLAGVRAPGVGRLLTNLLPGVTAATSLLMLVNGFWFLMMILAQIKAGGAPGGGSVFGGFGGELIVQFGSGLSRPTQMSSGAVVGGEWWRLVTPIFLHGGLLHFFFNSYLLLYLGPVAEGIYGTPRFWVIYLTCGIAGSLASQVPRYVNTVGASGAIMGLMGLLLVFGFRRGSLLGESVKRLTLRIVIYSIVLGLFFNIDHLNHIGGFACGALLALIVPDGEFRNRNEGLLWQVLAGAGVLLVIFAFYQVAVQGRLNQGI